MEYRPLEITVISAADLKNVNLISKMDVYVVVSIPTATKTNRKRTRVEKNGGRSPNWNCRLEFLVDEYALSPHHPNNITFKIKSQRVLGDREIGEVVVPIKHLLNGTTTSAAAGGGDGPSERVVDYQVRSTSGQPKGTFKFSYKFGETTTVQTEAKTPNKVDLPVTAYPPPGIGYATTPPPGNGYTTAPPPQMGAPYGNPAGYSPPRLGYGYQPPPPGYGGGYPSVPAYGYAPLPQAGYGAYGYGAPVVQQGKKKKKNMGGGEMGMGLGMGLLGGLLVGDMISDVGEMGYFDGGF